MRRVVAVLGAVLMVGVALLVRGGLDGEDDSADGGSADGNGDGAVTLLCVDELEAVCAALVEADAIDGFDTEAVGDTVDRLAEDEELGADGWLTIDGFPGMADVARDVQGLGPLFDDVTTTDLGTGVGIATAPMRTGAWREACGGDEVTWECVGDLVGEPWEDHGGQAAWNEITLGIDAPATSATGLLVVAQAVGAHLGVADYASNDLQTADTRRWVRDLTDGLDGDERNTLTTMITQQGSYSAVGSLVNAAAAVAETDRGDGTGVFYAAPMYAAGVVVARPGGSADELLDGEALDEALGEGDWIPLPDADPLPDAGTLYALRESLS